MFLDCKGNPYGKPDLYFYGNLLEVYFPTAAPYRALGTLREKKGTNFPTEMAIRISPVYSLAKECCPPEFVDEIMSGQMD